MNTPETKPNFYTSIASLSDEHFRRRTGVKRPIFSKMIEILNEAEKQKYAQGGRPHKLKMEERVLMWLEYLREYRTYFHTGSSYGLSESNCFRTCVWIENTLTASGVFALPKRTSAWMGEQVLVIDATESPIDRPKKDKNVISQARKRNTP